jgi:DNA-binding Lrp family transcriptional regulator
VRAIFVQIKCDMGRAYQVAQEAADTIPEMSELFSTSGQYDLLGKFYLEPGQDIGLFVTDKIQTLPGVRDTYTLIAFNAFGGGMRTGIS